MKYTDHHVHTSYSPDSEADIREYIVGAKKLGLDFVMFTDHVDFGTTDEMFMEHIDYGKYFGRMKLFQEECGFPVQVGVEIGYEKENKTEIEEFLASYPFDFVIGSIHYGDGKDFYLGDFFTGKDQNQAYQRYFEILHEMVENFDGFDVVGHLDYIIRYGPFDKRDYRYHDFSHIIDSILQRIIDKGKGIELNTSGHRGPLGTAFPKREVLERYRDLGGRTITIGSDAHFNQDYCSGIPEAMEHLKSLGFETVSSFRGRRETRLTLG
jgi:histidinol-phosphatase (PHP family)